MCSVYHHLFRIFRICIPFPMSLPLVLLLLVTAAGAAAATMAGDDTMNVIRSSNSNRVTHPTQPAIYYTIR